MRQPLKNDLCTRLAVLVLLLVVALVLILILIVLLILGVLTVLAVLVLIIRVAVLVLAVLLIIVRHICDLLIGNIFFSYRSSMSISYKNIPKNYGTLELNFFLHFCVISTIIRIVNRNPFMILFAPLCIIYLYSPHESHQLPPGGSLRWNYAKSINITEATVRCSHL